MGNWAVIGLLGVGVYNSMQYLALRTRTPVNVPLIAASTRSTPVASGGITPPVDCMMSSWPA